MYHQTVRHLGRSCKLLIFSRSENTVYFTGNTENVVSFLFIIYSLDGSWFERKKPPTKIDFSTNQSINQSVRTSIAPISPEEARLSGAPNKSVSKSQNPGFGPKTSTDNRVCRHLRRESQIKEMCLQTSPESCC